MLGDRASVPYFIRHPVYFLSSLELQLTSFKAYIQHFSYKAITTEDWKSFLYSYFDSEKEKLDQVDWDLWFNKPGLAPVKGQYDTSLQDVCTKVFFPHWGSELRSV